MSGSIISPQLKEAVDGILNDAIKGVTYIKAKVVNADAGLEIPLLYINEFSIEQDFEGSISDCIMCSFDLNIEEYKKLYANQKNNQLEVSFEKVDKDTDEITMDEPPKIYMFDMAMTKTSDLDKEINVHEVSQTGESGMTDTMAGYRQTVDVQLFEKNIIDVCKKKVGFTMPKGTLSDVIKYALSLFGSEKVKVVPPHRTKTYSNLYIPPTTSFDQFFSYLQQMYGVYTTGCGYYITGGVAYVYPLYDYDRPEEGGVCHIYSTPPNSYSGIDGTMRKDGEKDYSVISSGENKVMKLEDRGTENSGNSFIFLSQSDLIDGVTNDAEGTEFKDSTQSIAAVRDSVVSDSYNTSYMGVVENTYPHMADICEYTAERAEIGFGRAIPFTFTPLTRLLYTYDAAKKCKTQKGIITKVKYIFTKAESQSKRLFTCSCQMSAMLDPSDYTEDV